MGLCISDWKIAMVRFTYLWSCPRCVLYQLRDRIPRLELCGALILAQLLSRCKDILELPMDSVYAWTDSTIMLTWIQGSPRRFKVFVGNRVSQILELTRWNHVISEDNPADCASRGVFPADLLRNELWWNGPKLPASEWPKINESQLSDISGEVRELRCINCNILVVRDPLVPFDKFRRSTTTSKSLLG